MNETTVDPRHEKRVKQMQQLFAFSFYSDKSVQNSKVQLDEDLQSIVEESIEIDALIKAAAPERPLAEINKVDLAILRLTVFESKHKKTPRKVLINEGIELAKEFGTESSPRFVNAVLGKLLLPTKETHE